MELFRISKTIHFMRYAVLLNIISLVTFTVSLFFIYHKGFNLSTEFTGGSIIEASYSGEKILQLDEIKSSLTNIPHIEHIQVQYLGSSKEIIIRLPNLENFSLETTTSTILSELQKYDNSFNINKTEFIGPQVGEKLLQDMLLSVIMLVIGIIFYLSIRFELIIAAAVVMANLHDVVIILGFFAFFQWEFSLSVLAGTLAALGYSVNESVIVMDRVRENYLKYIGPKNIKNTKALINKSITQTISRTIITHGSTQFMILSILLFGGASLHYFAVALTIGIWFGIYSSIFVSSSLALLMKFGKKAFHAETHD
ncbi:protein translocase subunit SecF [Candidatus Kinetoplastidibacterium crithidiae]|uniref:Protein-export membrane protein SecF n=1 Tax=Candidatus Kinetoplastidibacterium crithidiae TCC036E TaxID=1208918 RepID=M1LVX7_9PROT|nr:protein translocase subunit SecF [Candidatus Kinetoplastibacterium crithidii]AFZ83138.1 preprotein translocase subunit SecF [Candidatus Kinetoplastibacterium crithidii (ex Angomonas deanei ATCC 30255)]AGF47414.1 preprotein translocase subunit SecF [Candidatus Kinetoplastibacterium crithidii TCC036E]